MSTPARSLKPDCGRVFVGWGCGQCKTTKPRNLLGDYGVLHFSTNSGKSLSPVLPAMREAHLRLPPSLSLFLRLCRRLFLGLDRVLEVLDSFAESLGYLRNLLAAKKQHCDSKDNHELSSGKARQTSSLNVLRKHRCHLSYVPIVLSPDLLSIAYRPETFRPRRIIRISTTTAQLCTMAAKGTIRSPVVAARWPSTKGASTPPIMAKVNTPLK